MESALVLRDIRKSFGSTKAVDGIDLTVPRGALYGVIGPNGAGKTTCIRMIMSILFPDSGELSVLGRRSALEAKDRIGYLPEERGVYRKMKVGAFLIYMAQLKGMRTEDAAARVPDAAREHGAAGHREQALRGSVERACCSACSSSARSSISQISSFSTNRSAARTRSASGCCGTAFNRSTSVARRCCSRRT